MTGFLALSLLICKVVYAHPTDVLSISSQNTDVGVYIVVGGDIQAPIQAVVSNNDLSKTIALNDNGFNGDSTANDGIFTGFIEYDLQQNPRSKVALWMKGETIWQDNLPQSPNKNMAVKIFQQGTQSSIKIDTQIQGQSQDYVIQDFKTTILQLCNSLIFLSVGIWIGQQRLSLSKKLRKNPSFNTITGHQNIGDDDILSHIQDSHRPILWLSKEPMPSQESIFAPQSFPIQVHDIPKYLSEISLHFEDVIIFIDGVAVLEEPLDTEPSDASLQEILQRHPNQSILYRLS